jgi:hypothetical protein
MKKYFFFFYLFVCLFSCTKFDEHKVVICIPVYGQSLALGEEAELITNFDSLSAMADGRIVTENLDHDFGFFDNDKKKQWAKKILNYTKRTFELSVYGMAESLVNQLGKDTLICIFPGGQGATDMSRLNRGNDCYIRFLENINTACLTARGNGWDFYVPAICWMQGESDVFYYFGADYKKNLLRWLSDFNEDIRKITHQQQDVRIICYQTNLLTNAVYFQADSFECREMAVPQAMMELIRDDTLFWASGPTYPYNFVHELKHLDGVSQKRFGYLAAVSALGIVRGTDRFRGLVPTRTIPAGTDVQISFNVPQPPLILDTLLISNPSYYGFSVIAPGNRNILQSVFLKDDVITLHCSESVVGCKVRYAVNGETLKSGWKKGPRGNLRDSQGDSLKVDILGKTYPLHNWCYQFELQLE